MGKHRISDRVMDQVEILAKLELNAEERARAREKMEEILDYVEKLQQLDTGNVEPLVHLWEGGNVFREDEVTSGDGQKELLANAPEKKNGQLQVPKTI